jgi:hypothetical protein
VVFTAWLIAVLVVLLRAIRRQEEAKAAPSGRPEPIPVAAGHAA